MFSTKNFSKAFNLDSYFCQWQINKDKLCKAFDCQTANLRHEINTLWPLLRLILRKEIYTFLLVTKEATWRGWLGQPEIYHWNLYSVLTLTNYFIPCTNCQLIESLNQQDNRQWIFAEFPWRCANNFLQWTNFAIKWMNSIQISVYLVKFLDVLSYH